MNSGGAYSFAEVVLTTAELIGVTTADLAARQVVNTPENARFKACAYYFLSLMKADAFEVAKSFGVQNVSSVNQVARNFEVKFKSGDKAAKRAAKMFLTAMEMGRLKLD